VGVSEDLKYTHEHIKAYKSTHIRTILNKVRKVVRNFTLNCKNMKNTMLRYVFDKKKQSSIVEVGLLQIEVRLVGTNVTSYISTGIKLTKAQFSDKNGFTCIKHPNATNLMYKARTMFNLVESFVQSDKCKEISDVRNWDKVDVCDYSVVGFIKERLKKKDPSFSVIEYHNSLIKRIEEFGKFKTFDDLTYLNLLDFDSYLRKTIKSQPTLYKRHTAFKGYVRMAIKAGLCKYDPYTDFEYKKGKSKEATFLTEEEVGLIQNFTPPSDSLKRIKDLFILQCFTGMAYVDLMAFDKSKIKMLGENKILSSTRTKTDESYISLLLPEAEAILLKYDYVLPRITNEKYNDYLKLVGAGAGLNKNLTTHVARHTYATYLLNRNIPIETVSRCMGHANIRMTQNYARMLGKKVVDDMQVLLK